MEKYVVALVLALVAGLALALELPGQSAVVVTDASGSVVGFGAYRDGSLELSVSEDASGFPMLGFATGSGEVVTVEDGLVVAAEAAGEHGAEVRAVAESARGTQGAPDLSGLPVGGPDDPGAEAEDSEEGAQGESGSRVAGEAAGEVASDIVGEAPSAPSKP